MILKLELVGGCWCRAQECEAVAMFPSPSPPPAT